MRSKLDGVMNDDITALFSDIDGTIAHYTTVLEGEGYTRVADADEAAAAAKIAAEAEEGENQMTALLAEVFPPPVREARFRGLPAQYWLHTATGAVVRTYELYNTTLAGRLGKCLISENTILLMELLQSPAQLYHGLPPAEKPRRAVLCTLMTGARTSTYEGRRGGGALPHVAFDVYEGGGKMACRLENLSAVVADGAEPQYCPDSLLQPPAPDRWSERFAAITGYGSAEPSTSAPLLKAKRALEAAGFRTDDRAYDTSFLVDVVHSPCLEGGGGGEGVLSFRTSGEAERYLVTFFADDSELEVVVNLGKAQVGAKGCNKLGAMQHILHTVQSQASGTQFTSENSVALFDDDNDLPFAKECAVGFLPSVSHVSVLDQDEIKGRKKIVWFRPPFDGLLGTEWALWQVALFKRNR